MAGEELSLKQKRFCEEYIRDFNASGAARRAGYSEKSCALIGHENIRKPNVKEYIDFLLEEATLSANQTIKSISDIARGDLKPYFVTRQKIDKKKVRIGLQQHIENLKEEIDTREYIHDLTVSEGFYTEGEELDEAVKSHKATIRAMKMAIIPHQVRLAKDPSASIIIDGPEELIERAELDLAKLIKDKDAGKIKSYQMTEFGPKIELYPADAALRDVGRYHKLFDKDKEDPTNAPPEKIKVEVIPPKPVDD